LFTLNAGVAKAICKTKNKEDSKMTKQEKTTVSNPVVAAQLADALLQKSEWKTRYLKKDVENKLLKRQLNEANKVLEGELRSDLLIHIRAKGDFNEADLATKNIEELQQIDATLSKAKGVSATYKPIRTAGDTEQKGLTTVGSLYGKTKEEILAMGGEH
jgi:uncharacterized membrane protein YheB (UPF0754 family)